MEIEIKKHMKLKVAEQNLAALLQKIDTEINQTDIQWMHLKSLIPVDNSNPPKAEMNQLKPPAIAISSKPVKKEHHIDDEAVNETMLDLSLGDINIEHGSSSEEDNSD